MSRNFVASPRDVVKPGDIVRVKVLGVDVGRKRISLTLRLDDIPERDGRGPAGAPPPASGRGSPTGDRPGGRSGGGRSGAGSGGGRDAGTGGGAMADAIRRAGLAGGPGDGQGSRSGR
jgi:uncharacterized protein